MSRFGFMVSTYLYLFTLAVIFALGFFAGAGAPPENFNTYLTAITISVVLNIGCFAYIVSRLVNTGVTS